MASRRNLLNSQITLPGLGMTANIAVIGGLAVLAWFVFLKGRRKASAITKLTRTEY